MNSKFLIIVGIFVAALIVFGVALSHSQNKTPGVTPAATSDTSSDTSTDITDVPQISATTSATITAPTARLTPKVAPARVPAPPASSAVLITIKKYMFTPQTITVKKGTKVTWTNTDIAKHTVTFDDSSSPSSQFFGQGQTYSYTFSTVGTYAYHCEPHPYMTATVVVTE